MDATAILECLTEMRDSMRDSMTEMRESMNKHFSSMINHLTAIESKLEATKQEFAAGTGRLVQLIEEEAAEEAGDVTESSVTSGLKRPESTPLADHKMIGASYKHGAATSGQVSKVKRPPRRPLDSCMPLDNKDGGCCGTNITAEAEDTFIWDPGAGVDPLRAGLNVTEVGGSGFKAQHLSVHVIDMDKESVVIVV